MNKKFVNGKKLLVMKKIFFDKTILKIFFKIFFEEKIVREKKKFWTIFIDDENCIFIANIIINDAYFYFYHQ